MLPSGGGIRVLRQFVTGLSENCEVRVFRPSGGACLDRRTSTGETVIPYPLWRRPAGLLRPAAPVFLLWRLLSFRSVCRKAAAAMNVWADAAVIHNTMPVAAPPVTEYLRVPGLYFCYEYPRHIYESDIIQRSGSRFTEALLKPLKAAEKAMDRKAVAAAGNIATFSTYMRDRIRSIYRRESAIVRPGVDTSFFSPAAGEERGNYLLSVGALWPFKGHETALRVLAAAGMNHSPELVIIADRAYPGHREHLERTAAAAGIRLTVMEGVTDTELRELYRHARLVICCQRREPYGLVPLEAMACGTPVLAIAEGGFIDNIDDGETGFLFDGTVCNGAQVLRGILEDRKLSEAAASRGRSFIVSSRSLTAGTDQLIGEIGRL